MNEDPYSALFGLMRAAGQPSGPIGPVHLRLGTVLSAAPLKVDVAGTVQEADRFFISHRLVDKHQEHLHLDCSGIAASLSIHAACGNGSHNSMTAQDGTLDALCTASQEGPVLVENDLVLLLTEDDQVFFLVDKVVKAG